jgi:signal transduction histidine kinase
LVAALRAAATTLTAGTGVQLAFSVDGTVGYVPAEVETDLLRIAQEAITNSVKHAAARTLEVRVQVTERELALHIRDDGRGIAPQPLPAHDSSKFGITAMRERVERHGGRLDVHGVPGEGTVVIARVKRHYIPNGSS